MIQYTRYKGTDEDGDIWQIKKEKYLEGLPEEEFVKRLIHPKKNRRYLP